jgi:predicted Fe-Mo cluster-binding NifX family protein
MNVLIPVMADNGLQSEVSAHFGSAPAYLVVDTDTGATRPIVNENQHHGHGGCAPLAILDGVSVEAIVVGGIGAGALGRLNAAGIDVYFADRGTVGETVDGLKAGRLNRMQAVHACGGHGHGHGGGCHHHQHEHGA